MAIQALSSVTNNAYSKVSFGKRGEKPAKNHSNPHVASSLKAVPLAALIAMSPLNTTNAKDIMRSEYNQNTIELAQQPQEGNRMFLYPKLFKSANGNNVVVAAVNTKGQEDSFDKIILQSGGFEFEAKDLVDREIYLYSGNGGKEGPLQIKEVITETELDGKKQRFSFVDPQIVNYVENIVAQSTNESNIKGIRKANSNLIITPQKCDLAFVDDNYIKNTFIPKMKENFTHWFYSELMAKTKEKGKEKGILTELKDLSIKSDGTFGDYTIRFYDLDKDTNNFELITIQKDGENEYFFKGFTEIDGNLLGVDDQIPTGKIFAIRLQQSLLELAADGESLIMTDDFLLGDLLNALKSPKFNTKNAGYLSINSKTANIGLGND